MPLVLVRLVDRVLDLLGGLAAQLLALAQVFDLAHARLRINLVRDRSASRGRDLLGHRRVSDSLRGVDDLVVALPAGFRAEHIPGGGPDNVLVHGGQGTAEKWGGELALGPPDYLCCTKL